MSAILSAETLNDFITPGVACIKPVETLPAQKPAGPSDDSLAYEVTTEDKVANEKTTNAAGPAQISLTDCLACSGCVTSAEAVLISLQSHEEVLEILDKRPAIPNEILGSLQEGVNRGCAPGWLEHKLLQRGIQESGERTGKASIFVATVSPQTCASIATTYNTTTAEARNMISQLLSGPYGLRAAGKDQGAFHWVLDTDAMRDVVRAAVVEETNSVLAGTAGAAPVTDHRGSKLDERAKLPLLSSACPGWICYAEKKHPHILPHLSRIKSPQALTGTLVKSVLATRLGLSPDRIWHLAVMPCFDKKLEASRAELTDELWAADIPSQNAESTDTPHTPVRDVDCVITARELVMLADARGISFPSLPRTPPQQTSFLRPRLPDPTIDTFLFPPLARQRRSTARDAGSSGGYAYQVILARQRAHPGSSIVVERGRNSDVLEYRLVDVDGTMILFKTARYYGFRNIQNLVRRLKPEKKSRMPGSRRAVANGGNDAGMADTAYIEIKAEDVAGLLGDKMEDIVGADIGEVKRLVTPAEQKEWLARVDEAYFSGEETEAAPDAEEMEVDVQMGGGTDDELDAARRLVDHWAEITGVSRDKLLYTTYRRVESDVGKEKGKGSDMERVVGLASSIGGGW